MTTITQFKQIDLTVKSSGDARLFVRSWRSVGDPGGVVVIVPGFNAHSGRYE
jgi:alpha-beta hydrolase superfamily lysophospholipase